MNFSDQQEKNVEHVSTMGDAIQSNNSEYASLVTSLQDDSSMGDEESDSKPRLRSDGKRHVEKGSLTEAELIEAKIQAQNRRKQGGVTEEDKREERRAANRLSAFQSRRRRKLIIQDLGKTVAQLCRENTEQRQSNVLLQKQIEELRAENERLRKQVRAATAPIRTSPTADINSLTTTNNNQSSSAAQLLAILQLIGAQQQPAETQLQRQQSQPITFPAAAAANQDVTQLFCTVRNLVNDQNSHTNQHASAPVALPSAVYPNLLSASLPTVQQSTTHFTLQQQLALLQALSSQKKE